MTTWPIAMTAMTDAPFLQFPIRSRYFGREEPLAMYMYHENI